MNFIQRLPGHEALADSPLVRDDQDAAEHRVAFGQRVQGSGQKSYLKSTGICYYYAGNGTVNVNGGS